jgi:acetylornithine/LysW-gamma-L-lysine aminotransferase
MKNFRFLQQKYLVNTYPDRVVTLTRGEGVYLFDEHGKRFLDLMTNYGVNIFGYNHPHIQHALCNQLKKLTTIHGSFNNDTRAEAAQKLIQRCGGGLTKVFFSNSGSEAIEAALKFSVLATGKKRFISCEGGYHGKTLGALSANGKDEYRSPFEPLLWEFQRINYNDISQLEDALDNKTSAFLVEPIQGEGGIILPDPGYLKAAREVCREKNVLMVVDEIQTGAGRTGRFLASQNEIDEFDIICMGKGLAGGIPVGATLVSDRVAAEIPRLAHSSTFGGNPLAAAGILAVLQVLDEKMTARVKDAGDYFLRSLKKIGSALIIDTKGAGLMIGVDVKEKRDAILQGLQKEGILAVPAADSIVRFLPSYILETDHIDTAVSALDRVLETLKA